MTVEYEAERMVDLRIATEMATLVAALVGIDAALLRHLDKVRGDDEAAFAMAEDIRSMLTIAANASEDLRARIANRRAMHPG